MRRAIGMCAAAMTTVLVGGVSGQITTELVASGIDRPVFMTTAPGEPDKLFVIEQEGAIRIIENGVLLPIPFLDIDPQVTGGSSGQSERGLLGLAFSPDYETSGRFFVNYTGPVQGQSGTHTIIAEYHRSNVNSNIADTTERIILTFPQPFSNHNGGWMDFGPNDGFLYIATGDGGSANDPGDRASDLNEFLGKILRIDVSDDQVTYTIPPGNPFVGVAGAREEIWAYGLRNPWRTSFDSATGDLWIADVGQGAREEVNYQAASSTGGEHYGWRCREGTIENPSFPGCTITPSPYTEPVHDYPHTLGRCSITGGYLYRGCAVPELDGLYLFGDYCSGDVYTLDPNNGFAVNTVLNVPNFSLSSFGEDAMGEIYVMDLFGGTISRIVSTNPVDDNNNGIPDGCEETCLPDINMDGMLDASDFTAWVAAFNANDPIADQNLDGLVNVLDFNAWIANFNAGCN
ncbi:MAG TPA: glucose dehydrogenase [Phycisphaerales bacterium]|nr:glucose dehydrogenase [Phycisphaerales bacterium]